MEKITRHDAMSMARKVVKCRISRHLRTIKKITLEDEAAVASGCFKKCARCNYCWSTRDLYLNDPRLRIVGYQANFDNLELGTFMFSHMCGTTMSIHAKEFVDLYTGQVFEKRATDSSECPKYCLNEDELKACDLHCECAYIRKVALIIQHWPKLRQF